MTDHPSSDLDRLWDRVPPGAPPLGDLLRDGHAAVRSRRRRGAVLIGAAVAVAGIVVGSAWLGVGGRIAPPANSPDEAYRLTVTTVLEGPGMHYFEGALGEVDIWPTQPDITVESALPGGIGWSHVWPTLPAGEYDVEAAVRPCGGDCGSLDPPTDSCAQSVSLTSDLDVVVTFHYGEPCRISVRPSLTDQQYSSALAAASGALRDQEATLTSAAAKVVDGTLTASNTGYNCESGQLLKIKIVGTFPMVVVGGSVKLPGVPRTDGDRTVHAVLITADPETGRACLIGVQTGDVEPLAGGTPLELSLLRPKDAG